MTLLVLKTLTSSPIVACCRYHHRHCDTPLDLHSPYEGFWHAHIGWLFRAADVERPLLDRANVEDLAEHAFYRWLEETWVAHMLGRLFLTWVRVLLLLRHTVLLSVYTCCVVLSVETKRHDELHETSKSFSGAVVCTGADAVRPPAFAHPVA